MTSYPQPINTTYDIETGCPVLADGRTPDDELLLKAYGPFDPTAVKVPAAENKSPEDRAAYLAKKEAEYLPEIRSSSALNPLLAVVTAIVYNRTGTEIVASGGEVTEEHLLEDFWARYEALGPGEAMIGWNNFGFDDEMLIQRSIVRGIKVPEDALRIQPSGNRRLLKSRDLAPALYGDPNAGCRRGGLERASLSLGGPGKNGDGAFFSELARSGDPEKVRMAFDYLKNDEIMTRVVASHLGLVAEPVPVRTPGQELIVTPRSRYGVPLDVTRAVPAIDPDRGHLPTTLTPPVLFGFVMTPKGDDVLTSIFGRFDPTAVEVPKKYTKNVADLAAYLQKEEIEHYEGIRKTASGDGLNSVIRAAGYLKGGVIEIVTGTEVAIVKDFWIRYGQSSPEGMAGWGNSAKEDDFIVMRSVANRVMVPPGAVRMSTSGYRSLTGVRDMAVALSGDVKDIPSLQHAAAAFGVPPPASREDDLPGLMRANPESTRAQERMAEHLTDKLTVMAHAAHHLLPGFMDLDIPEAGDPTKNLVAPKAEALGSVHWPQPSAGDADVPYEFPSKPAPKAPLLPEDSLLRGKATLPSPVSSAPPVRVTTEPDLG